MELLHYAEQAAGRFFYLGSRAVAARGRELTEQRFPNLRIQFHHGYSPDDPAARPQPHQQLATRPATGGHGYTTAGTGWPTTSTDWMLASPPGRVPPSTTIQAHRPGLPA
ncbi:MAG: hypothetical protein R3E50_00025 [Halioglobus sp.]